jgi:zinc protease
MNDKNSYYQFSLSNGLKVLMKKIFTAPIISTWIWYEVGTRNEVKGKTGISHWCEHMLFKDTKNNQADVYEKTIARLGGEWNAFTHLDWTTYFETLPADAYKVSLQLESDRMINSLFDCNEVEKERTVIVSEREGSENSPLFQLDELVQKEAIVDHPYQHEVIGSLADLRSISRDDLYDHYKHFYHPGNATLCIAGNFDHSEMQKKVQEYFGNIEGHPKIEVNIPPGQRLSQEKRIEKYGPGDTTYIQIAYPAPNAKSVDFFALSIIDSLLTGPSGLNMFGSGSVSNKTSRLYEQLVQNEIVVAVNGSLQATIDPFLYNIVLIVHPNKTAEEALSTFDIELEKMQSCFVSETEILKAIKQAKALFAYGSENITNHAFWLGYANAFDSYAWFENYIEKLSEIDSKRVLDIAQKYLQKNSRVVGIYMPKEKR